MGCLWARPSQPNKPVEQAQEQQKPESPKQYSWDKRAKVDPKQFTVENLVGESHVRASGSVNGQQFIIQNCKDSNIYIFDHTATVSIDDCTGCKIFLGPIHTSVFVRNCSDCVIALACQQFRTRDCRKLTVFLCVTTQPIIEASTGIRLACLQCHYTNIEAHFRQAQLSVFNNNWAKVHDFTPVQDEHNFSVLPEDIKLSDLLPAPPADSSAGVQLVLSDSARSVVPLSLGTRRKCSDESCLVVFFNDGQSTDRALNFIAAMKRQHSQCVLVQSRELVMQPGDCQRVFDTDSYANAARQGPVIALEYNGDGCCSYSQEQVILVSKGSTGLVFVSNSPAAATRHIDGFFTFSNMQMLP